MLNEGARDPRLIDAFYRAVSDHRALPIALDMLGGTLGAVSTALISLDALRPDPDLALTTGIFDETARRRYQTEFIDLDPAPPVFARLRPGMASTTDRLMLGEMHRGSAFLNEFYYPLGLSETIGGLMASGSGRFELLGIHRGTDRGAFTDAELAYVEEVMPHLQRALQLRRAFFELEVRTQSLKSAMDRFAVGVVLIDRRGMPVYVNAAARTIAVRHDGMGLDRTGRPLPTDGEARKRLDLLLADVRAGGAGGVVAVPTTAGGHPYAVLVAPAPPALAGDGLVSDTPAAAIVLIHDPATRAVAPVEIVQQAMNLPRAAADLVLALAQDGDLKSFAEEHGITIHTARFHLRTALARTGTRTQVELVRLAVRMLRNFEIMPHV